MTNAMKGTNTLSSFLRQKSGKSSTADVDWNAKKNDWIASIEQLYDFLTGTLLKQSIDEKIIEVSKVPKQITEEHIGTYTLPELHLKVGNAHVVFSPKGVNVIGAAGRVDLRGERNTVTLIREKDINDLSSQWKMVRQRVPKLVAQPLDADSLQWALEDVML